MKACVCATCPLRGEPQPEWQFYRLNSARDGLQSWCKACMKAARQRDRERYPEREREYCRRSYQRIKADPERYAIHLDTIRESHRRRLGITPDRFRVNVPRHEPLVESAPILTAALGSGLSFNEIEARAGVGEGALRKARERPTMRAATAVAILDALGLDAVDVGI